ncbi:MAG: hypothetical protein ACFB15_12055 [Cyclobacteriaceae bacterium]
MKRIIGVLILGLLLIITAYLSANWWISNNLQTLINSNPERAYDITYDKLDIHLLLKGVRIQNLTIQPVDKEAKNPITVSVAEAEIRGLRWQELLTNQAVKIGEMTFIEPDFEIVLDTASSDQSPNAAKNLQYLFGDVLSRADVEKFTLRDGSARARMPNEEKYFARLNKLNLFADKIETDSLQWKHLIPFEVDQFYSKVEGVSIQLDSSRTFSCEQIEYSLYDSKLAISNASIDFLKDWRYISSEVGVQTDLINFQIKSLEINQLDTESKLSGDLDIRAQSVVLDSLVFNDYRDKNQPNPPDQNKPLFGGLVASIPFPLKVDTVLIRNSQITYHELGEEKKEPGAISFNNTYGSIYNITTIPSFQSQFGQFEADLITLINRQAKAQIRLEVPYVNEQFRMSVAIDSFYLASLNSVIVPLVDVQANAGKVHKMLLSMNADEFSSKNQLVLDYDDLNIKLLKENTNPQAKKKKKRKKRGVLSSVANLAIRHRNLPDDKNYVLADYRTQRNVYRGAFNLIWVSIKEGMAMIIPTQAAQAVLSDNRKLKKRKKEQID